MVVSAVNCDVFSRLTKDLGERQVPDLKNASASSEKPIGPFCGHQRPRFDVHSVLRQGQSFSDRIAKEDVYIFER